MIKIISSDNVSFEVEAFHLQSASDFFRDLISDSQLKSGGEPVLIDASADVVGIFISMVSQTYKYDTKQPFTALSIEALLRLSELYLCDIVKHCLQQALSTDDLNLPGPDLFLFAARIDAFELAKMAISKMGSFDETSFDQFNLHEQPVGHIDVRYIQGYMRAGIRSWMLLSEEHEFSERKRRDLWTTQTCPSGEDVAKHFEL